MSRICFILSLLLIFTSSGSLAAQDNNITYSSEVDWQLKEMVIDVEAVFPPGSDSLRMRDSSEDLFRHNFFDIFNKSVREDRFGPLYFNSYYTIEESIQKNPQILSRIDEISNNIIKVFTVYNQDMAGVRMQYKLNIYRDIARYFVTHSIPQKPEKNMVWTSSADFTGVVIYAADDYPVHGENAFSRLNPALFPSVYDENIEKVFSMEMVDPEVLTSRGPLSYFSNPDDPGIAETAGEKPLYTMARKIFGKYRTDIIIPTADADRIFYSEKNAALIREGRFVIICTLPSDRP